MIFTSRITKTIRTLCAVLAFCLVWTAPAQAAAPASERVTLDGSGKHILIQKSYLKSLVYRLENEQRLKLENPRLKKQIRLFEKLGDSLKKEMRQQQMIIAELRKSLSIAKDRHVNSESRITVLKNMLGEQKESIQTSKDFIEEQEQIKLQLRRRLAGQTITTWAVSAVGGALLILLLI